MKNFSLLSALVGLSLISILSGCNGGMNIEIPQATAESSGLDNGGTDPVSSPSPAPTPGVVGKNRIFVSSEMVTAINPNGTYFNDICNKDAQKAKITGNFVALLAANSTAFLKTNAVNGYIYQKAIGAEIQVADSFQALIAGNNTAIYANANQQVIDNSYKNYAWTGQNDFNQPASSDLNCKNWTIDQGYGIVGQIGATGSDALASRYQGCDITAHVYCIETN